MAQSRPGGISVEVDQSGKIEATNVNTVLAFSGPITGTLLISAVEKRAGLQKLRGRGKSGRTWYLKVFAAALYLLLREQLVRIDQIIVDIEYPGREAEILGMFLNFARKDFPDFSKNRVSFRAIGKKLSAHEAAIAVYREERTLNLRARASNLLRLIK